MDCDRNDIDKKLVEDLMLCAGTLCDSIRDTPCGCEGCWIWQAWYYSVKNGNPTEEELEEYKCALDEVMEKLGEQIRGRR